MSIDQTTQLIQLTLNSVLLLASCALLSHRLGVRHLAIEERLQTTMRQYAVMEAKPSDRFLQTKKQLRQLQHRHRLTHYSLVTIHLALLLSLASTLTLSLRMLLPLDWLVIVALGLFCLSLAVLLVGVALTLIDLYTCDRALWDEVALLLSFSRADEARSRQARRAERSAERARAATTRVKSLRARVG